MKARTSFKTLLFCLLFTLSRNAVSQTEAAAGGHPFTLHASYVGDLLNNMRGGIKTGSCFLGMAGLTIGYEAGETALLSGAHIFLKAANTHGAHASQALVGDFQVASNIEAGDHTYIQELWYRQDFGRLSAIVGLQDLNALFAANEYSGLYLNSSFGIHSTISSNGPAPIFPLTSAGATLVWNAWDQISLLGAVFDGSPIDFQDNPYNLKWKFNTGDGVFAVTEVQASIGGEDARRTTVKLGYYQHDHYEEGSEGEAEGTAVMRVHRNNYGVYCAIDQMVYGASSTAGSIAAFARASISPRSINDNFWFAGAGVNYYGLFNEDGSDVIGIAFAHAGLETTDDETAIELTYQMPIAETITLQPDLQFIIHPVGAEAALPNSVIVTLRFAVAF